MANRYEPWTELREARQRAGLSQAELAGRAGMGYSQISKLERGVADVLQLNVGNLAALADALGMTMDELLGGRRKILKTLPPEQG